MGGQYHWWMQERWQKVVLLGMVWKVHLPGTAWLAVPEAARFSAEAGSSLGRCFGGDSAVVVGRLVVSGA